MRSIYLLWAPSPLKGRPGPNHPQKRQKACFFSNRTIFPLTTFFTDRLLMSVPKEKSRTSNLHYAKRQTVKFLSVHASDSHTSAGCARKLKNNLNASPSQVDTFHEHHHTHENNCQNFCFLSLTNLHLGFSSIYQRSTLFIDVR